jgi:Mg2+/Co2+ transporter CorB
MKLFSWLQDSALAGLDSEDAEPPLAPALKARLIELKGMKVKDVMVPRALITALDADVQLRRVRRLKSAKTAYFPVYAGDLDHILGWISKQKVMDLMQMPTEDVLLAKNVQPVGEIDEEATVAALADAFLKAASPFLVAKNATGQTTGLMPLSEFVELIFGFELAPGAQPSGHDVSALRNYEI